MKYELIVNKLNNLSKTFMIVIIILFLSLAILVYFNMRPYSLKTANELTETGMGNVTPPTPRSFGSYKEILKTTRVFRPPLYQEILSSKKGEKKSLQLQGITGKEGNRSALIFDPDTNSAALYKEGQFVRDLKVEKINIDSVTLAHDEDRIELKR